MMELSFLEKKGLKMLVALRRSGNTAKLKGLAGGGACVLLII